MKFPGTCVVCNKKIQANEMGLWAKGLGVKHERCAQASDGDDDYDELRCIICGNSAGCRQCELQDSCDIPNVSRFCVCKRCSEQENAFGLYQKSAKKKFPLIDT